MNDKLFISSVHERKILWDRRSADFKITDKKNAVWEEVGRKFDICGKDAEAYFRSLRQKYLRGRKNERARLGMGATASQTKPWHLKQYLKFLDDVILPRRTFTSLKTKPAKESIPSSLGHFSGYAEAGPSLKHGEMLVPEVEEVWLDDMQESPFSPTSDKTSASTATSVTSTLTQAPQTESTLGLGKTNSATFESQQFSISAPVDDWQVRPSVKHFCKYLGERLNALPEEKAYEFELKIMYELQNFVKGYEMGNENYAKI